jgi:isocitrate dehydrogenase
MMKVSDQLFWCNCRSVFLDVFEKYAALFAELELIRATRWCYAKIAGRPEQAEVEAAINQAIENGPALAMVNSDKGITTFMSLLIFVDASMPAMIRTSGQMWNKDENHKIHLQ